jgi:mannose-6-phosphate isomerase-like protein (cupin superfamily)
MSILKYLDKNFVGRDPFKETILACTPSATTRLLQLREPLAPHAHADADEILYVVAGEGVLRIAEEMTPVSSTSVSMIPRGLTHTLQRQGRNPLIVLSTLAGPRCESAPAELQFFP